GDNGACQALMRMDLVVYTAVPLLLLIALRIATGFPALMALLMFFLVPIGSAVPVAILGEVGKPRPNVAVILPAALFIYLFFRLPICGLWIVDFGVVGWHYIQRSRYLARLAKDYRILAGMFLGVHKLQSRSIVQADSSEERTNGLRLGRLWTTQLLLRGPAYGIQQSVQLGALLTPVPDPLAR